MNTILIALAFVGGLAGLVLVGMMVTMYFYANGALGGTRFRGAKGLEALTARSVPFQVTPDAGQYEMNLGLSNDQGTRYARGSMVFMAIVLLMCLVALISVLSTTLH
jgi:hypothetical protein